VIDIASRTLVRQIAFAACVPAAVSPVALRAAALNNRFREDVQLYNINGASGFLEGYASTGTPPEGDNTRDLAISPNDHTVVACNNVSRNATIFDVQSGARLAYIDTGERPLAAAVTHDGHYAVICGTDSNLVTVVDLTTNTTVATLTNVGS